LDLLHALRELFDYNYWARDRQFEACAALTAEEFRRPLGNSFPSLRDTLVHLVGVEVVWLERCIGNTPRAFPPADDMIDLPSIAARWCGIEQRVRDYLASLDDAALAEPFTYTNLTGQVWTYPLWRTLMHVVNHQTYHRGQVTMFLRQLGTNPVPVDVLNADDAGVFWASSHKTSDT
jgi:uncharacterized damage-inducible protein DinB